MEEKYSHQFSDDKSLISATYTLPGSSKYQFWAPETDAILVRSGSWARIRVGTLLNHSHLGLQDSAESFSEPVDDLLAMIFWIY